MTHMKNSIKHTIINSLSILAGKRFARLYSNPKNSSKKVLGALDTYRALRRMLPKVDGNHIGNHTHSKYRPWNATQGLKTRSFASPFA